MKIKANIRQMEPFIFFWPQVFIFFQVILGAFDIFNGCVIKTRGQLPEERGILKMFNWVWGNPLTPFFIAQREAIGSTTKR